MIIKKMTASYGRLQNESLDLARGLNIINAPNESGKSTWCSFIKSMLYGVDSSARERGGMKPDKLRYAPWSGAPMSGIMDIEHNGRNITLTRSGKDSAPMRELSATITGSAQPLSEALPNPGEAFLGIPRDVFERSAFIGQGSTPITASPELEKRIAAIVQTGDETSSYTQGEKKLKDAMHKRRFNKFGRLPEIEAELAEIRNTRLEIANDEQRARQLDEAKVSAIAQRDELTKKVAAAREAQRKSSMESLNTARVRVRETESALDLCREAEKKAEIKLSSGVFGGELPEKVNETVAAELERAHILEKKKKRDWQAVLALVLCLGSIAGAVVFSTRSSVPTVVFLVLSVAMLAWSLVLNLRRGAAEKKLKRLFAKYSVTDSGQLEAAAEDYAENYEAFTDAVKLRQEAEKELEAVKLKQLAFEESVIKELNFEEGGGEAVLLSRQLEDVNERIRRIRDERASLQGRISALGASDSMDKRAGLLEREHAKLTLEYDALALAAETLKEAGMEIQNRLTPRLSQRTGEIFARLTGERYDCVALDRELKALAKLSGDTLPHESVYLSVGALDQLYLALRLALCEMALPGDDGNTAPLILDDALVNFDDERCALALELLREMAAGRQILLFTCHGREARMMRENEDVNIIVG